MSRGDDGRRGTPRNEDSREEFRGFEYGFHGGGRRRRFEILTPYDILYDIPRERSAGFRGMTVVACVFYRTRVLGTVRILEEVFFCSKRMVYFIVRSLTTLWESRFLPM